MWSGLPPRQKNGNAEPTPFVLKSTSEQESSDWQERTLERLTTTLGLTPEQQQKVSKEVSATSLEIQTSRDQALKDYYHHLLRLHEQLLPHLNENQKAKIKKDQKSLQRALDSWFQSSIEE